MKLFAKSTARIKKNSIFRAMKYTKTVPNMHIEQRRGAWNGSSHKFFVKRETIGQLIKKHQLNY